MNHTQLAHKIGLKGLGLRREMLSEFCQQLPDGIDFLEVAPENWIPLQGRFKRQFTELTVRHPFVCHGLSLSLGSPDPLDIPFLKRLKGFFDEHQIAAYSEHLSYCSADGHLYDLLPIPFTEEAVDYVAARIAQVQDILERPLAVENVSFYAKPSDEMTELEFTQAVLAKADCKLLLDVNNVYVNSVNHSYCPYDFIAQLPSERILYGHIAGHYNEADDLIVDTHGADVIEPVWQLLAHAYRCHGVFPTLLERDFNIPSTAKLLEEVSHIGTLQQATHNEQTRYG